MNYYEIDFHIEPRDPWSDVLTAELADLGCDSFVETEVGMKAYGPIDKINIESLKQLPVFIKKMADDVKIDYSINEIQDENWNAVWEADFEPVYVDDRLAILAPFHSETLGKEITVWIQPQMSFGTGHHQTTWMMSKMLLEMETMPKNILDMGSGTGVLAILAEKLGGTKILAVDIDEWAFENCKENTERNNSKEITSLLGGIEQIENHQFNLIIANINKNILSEQIPTYSKCTEPNGTLLLSGFFDSDVDDLVQLSENNGFNYSTHLSKENWACIKLTKK